MSRTLLITGAQLIDGENRPPYRADVLIRDALIADIGLFGVPPRENANQSVINASGMYITPGFIDVHRHLDFAVFKPGFGTMELAQGITSAVGGLCGLSPYPAYPPHGEALHDFIAFCAGSPAERLDYSSYQAYASALSRQELPLTLKMMIGSCALRIAVKGFSASPFSPAQRRVVNNRIEEAMAQGAAGLSMGLMYRPEYYSARDDLISFAKTAASGGGLLAVHIRNEGDGLPAAISEAIAIAEAADIPLQISHFKTCGTAARRDNLTASIALIEQHRRSGTAIHADFYPYTGGATHLLSLIPPCCLRETPEGDFSYWGTYAGAQRLEAALTRTHENWDNYLLALGFERIVIASARRPHNAHYEGKTLAQLCDAKPRINPYRLIGELLADEQGQTGLFVMSMSQEDVDTIAALPWTMVASDALYPDSGRAHPRAWGTFPKILRETQSRGLLPLHTAVHKMTGLPARVLGFTNRGVLRIGAAADLCIFDINRVSDRGSFTQPPETAVGMACVLRGGKIMWRDNHD